MKIEIKGQKRENITAERHRWQEGLPRRHLHSPSHNNNNNNNNNNIGNGGYDDDKDEHDDDGGDDDGDADDTDDAEECCLCMWFDENDKTLYRICG